MTNPALNAFNAIYTHAKNFSHARINSIIAADNINPFLTHFSIDLHFTVEGAPVSKLAAENDHHAVAFLHEKFFASRHWAIYGYARANNWEKVAEYLEDSIDQPWNYFELVKFACRGFARAGHTDSAIKLLIKIRTKTQLQRLENIIWSGAAENLQINFLTKHINSLEPLPHIALGFARGGHIQFLPDLRSATENSPKIHLEILKLILRGLADTDHQQELNRYLELVPETHVQEFTSIVIRRFALKNQLQEALGLLEQTQNQRFILHTTYKYLARALSFSGNIAAAIGLRGRYNLSTKQHALYTKNMYYGLIKGKHTTTNHRFLATHLFSSLADFIINCQINIGDIDKANFLISNLGYNTTIMTATFAKMTLALIKKLPLEPLHLLRLLSSLPSRLHLDYVNVLHFEGNPERKAELKQMVLERANLINVLMTTPRLKLPFRVALAGTDARIILLTLQFIPQKPSLGYLISLIIPFLTPIKKTEINQLGVYLSNQQTSFFQRRRELPATTSNVPKCSRKLTFNSP